MGNSFKLQKGGNAKSQARSAGVLCVILGIVSYFLIWEVLGLILGVIGVVLVLASYAATE